MKHDALSGQLNEVWENGFAEEEYGSCQEEGFSSALIITDDIIGIIQEDDQGFVNYDIYTTEKEAREQWEYQVNVWQSVFNPEASYAQVAMSRKSLVPTSGYIIRVLNKYPKKHTWVGLIGPVPKRKHSIMFPSYEEAQECITELRKVYKKLTAKIIRLQYLFLSLFI